MPPTVRVKEIRAWIVAIEKYTSGLDVKAPIGRFALELAEGLLKRDPSVRIVMSTSLARPEYDQRLESLSGKVKRTGAAQADLQNALGLLKGTGTLLVYWVSHGIMDAEGRSLLCADSSQPGDLRSIQADSLLTYFRSGEFPQTQIGFFDCCAQVVGAPNRLQLGGQAKANVRQFFYYAASAGEVATADSTREGFSSTAVRALILGQVWPPNPVSLFHGVRERLAALPLATRPFSLEWTEESGDLWSRQGQTVDPSDLREARRAGLCWSEFEHLLRDARASSTAAELSLAIRRNQMPEFLQMLHARHPELAAVDLLEDAWLRVRIEQQFVDECAALNLFWDDWLVIYERLCKTDPISQATVNDLAELILTVLDQTKAENGLCSLIRILEMGARWASERNPDASSALVQAVKKHSDLGPLYDAAIRKLPDENGPVYLLLGLNYEPNTKIASLEQSWLFAGVTLLPVVPEATPTGPLATQLNHVIQSAIRQYPKRQLVVELLAPNDLLCASKSLLEVVDAELETCVWLEAQYAVTLRWHDRMKGDTRYLQGTWIQVAQDVRARIGKGGKLVCAWRRLQAPAGGVGYHVLGLAFPGPSPAAPKRNRSLFFQNMLEGAPYMCWPRDDQVNWKRFEKAASRFIQEHELQGLPGALREIRRQAGHTLCDLILFIDEPDRNPYAKMWRAHPSQRGAHE